jgi:Fic family protein
VWKPEYTLTDSITEAILEIGRAQGSVESHSWSPLVEERIRFKARVRSTHHSTAMDGNRLTLAEAEEVVRGRKVTFWGRKRDVTEVERHWKALALVHEWAEERSPLSEKLIRKLHAVVHEGLRAEHNDYDGRADVDLTPWVEYLTPGVTDVFALAAREALRLAEQVPAVEPPQVRALDARARRVLALFADRREITSKHVADRFAISPRAARDAIRGWVDDGFLEIRDRSNRGRSYGLSAVYRKYIGGLSEGLARTASGDAPDHRGRAPS